MMAMENPTELAVLSLIEASFPELRYLGRAGLLERLRAGGRRLKEALDKADEVDASANSVSRADR